MADVRVFVDDAVRGTLPRICAKDGVPTGDSLTIVEEVGRSTRLGVLWLLLLAGPLGWVVLLALAGRGSGVELLTVEVPLSESAYRRLVTARRVRHGGILLATGGGGAVLFLTMWAQLAAAGLVLTLLVAAAGIAVTIVGDWRADREGVGVGLDASRRWVTLRRVHPTFAAACEEQELRARG